VPGLSHEEAYALAAGNEASIHAKSSPGGIQYGLSTGTSDQRGIFMTAGEERARWAGAVIARCIPRLWSSKRIAFFLRANNQLYQAAGRGRWINLAFFDLKGSLDAHIQELNRFKPDLLIAPPYILALLSQQQEVAAEPETVISVADVLDPWDEAAIMGRFHTPIRQIYQATEGFLGASCTHGSLHLNEDLILFEKRFIHGSRQRMVPIISDFHRKTQALVRFELNDVLVLDEEPCGCGSPMTRLSRVEGRLDEIFFVRQGDSPGPIYRSDLASSLKGFEGVLPDFRFVQHGYEEFSLSVSPQADAAVWKQLSMLLQGVLVDRGVDRPRIMHGPHLNIALHEKRRRFVRRFYPEEL
ncbi:MAG: hypothetical protein M3Q07_28870, partial [Pseudobdellovibrionaceae bacterium]|nr:hypothetical protein [Pseudobdellovibrionaceae bacterium]